MHICSRSNTRSQFEQKPYTQPSGPRCIKLVAQTLLSFHNHFRRLQGQLRDVEGEAGSGDPAQHRVHQRHHPHHRHSHDRRRAALGSWGKLTQPWTHLFDCHDCRRQRHPGHRETVNEGTNNTTLTVFPIRSCARFCHMFLGYSSG